KLRALNAIRFGAEYNYSKDKTGYTRYNGESYPFNLTENIKAGFAEMDFYLSSVLAAKLGGRVEHSSVLNKTNFAPRTSIAYKLNKGTQVSLAYGIFYQNPETKYLPSTADLQFMKASHYIVQFQRMRSGQTFRTEIYYKRYKNLIKTGIVNNRETAIGNSGFGSAKGIEFFWRDKKSIKEFDYWISYSFLDTKRNFLNFPFAITPNFAARHTGSIILKKFVQQLKMNLNGSYNFASGRPYYYIGYDGMDYKFNERGMTPDYHNVSFSVNYLPFIGKKDAKSFVVYVFHVSNVFNFRQTYGYQYSTSGHRKEAIVPPSRMFLFIGAFLSFGIDRSDEVINNTL
ncbi:MAG TPA: TonB-dependent receptor, partial [Chitinophagaceae bacterium]|nr:TonB-dependent receptor [Chitinophagaceae bacterium]